MKPLEDFEEFLFHLDEDQEFKKNFGTTGQVFLSCFMESVLSSDILRRGIAKKQPTISIR